MSLLLAMLAEAQFNPKLNGPILIANLLIEDLYKHLFLHDGQYFLVM